MSNEKFKIEIEYSNFSTDGDWFKEGDQFIGLNINGKNRGMGSPCKGRGEIIKEIKNYMFNDGYAEGGKINT